MKLTIYLNKDKEYRVKITKYGSIYPEIRVSDEGDKPQWMRSPIWIGKVISLGQLKLIVEMKRGTINWLNNSHWISRHNLDDHYSIGCQEVSSARVREIYRNAYQAAQRTWIAERRELRRRSK